MIDRCADFVCAAAQGCEGVSTRKKRGDRFLGMLPKAAGPLSRTMPLRRRNRQEQNVGDRLRIVLANVDWGGGQEEDERRSGDSGGYEQIFMCMRQLSILRATQKRRTVLLY